jgi:hypothetical protein
MTRQQRDPELTITVQARLAAALNHLTPSAIARVLSLANRVLPAPTGIRGDRHRRGCDSGSRWAPSMVTTLSDRAAVANNQL